MGDDPIPVFRPSTSGMLEAVSKALEIGWLGMGPLTAEFERELAVRLGVSPSRVVCTGTGTAALHTALAAAGLGPGDEVIVPAINFAADAQAVLACGAHVVLCDVADADLDLDLTACEALVGPRTRAIMPLHYAGKPLDPVALSALATRHGLRVIEDASHALGSRYRDGVAVGGTGDLICFSFDPVKVITSLDGGAVVTSSDEDADTARRFRDLGITRDSFSRHADGAPWNYDVQGPGLRYHLNSVSAAIGLSQLRQLDMFAAERRRACDHYLERLRDVPAVRLPDADFTRVTPFIFWIRVPPRDRDPLRAALRSAGIATGLHFPPMQFFSAFAGMRRGDLTVTEAAGAELITLPLFVGMRQDQVDRITARIRAYFGTP